MKSLPQVRQCPTTHCLHGHIVQTKVDIPGNTKHWPIQFNCLIMLGRDCQRDKKNTSIQYTYLQSAWLVSLKNTLDPVFAVSTTICTIFSVWSSLLFPSLCRKSWRSGMFPLDSRIIGFNSHIWIVETFANDSGFSGTQSFVLQFSICVCTSS